MAVSLLRGFILGIAEVCVLLGGQGTGKLLTKDTILGIPVSIQNSVSLPADHELHTVQQAIAVQEVVGHPHTMGFHGMAWAVKKVAHLF